MSVVRVVVISSVYLGKGEVPVSVGVELLEELPPLLLSLVRPLEGELLVDGRPVHVAHLAALLVTRFRGTGPLDARRGRLAASGLGVSVLGRD